MLTVQQLTEDHLDAAVEAITGGFVEEQNFVLLFSNERTRHTAMNVFLRSMTRLAIRRGGVYAAIEDGNIIGGIVGYPPGVYPFSLWQDLKMAPMYLRLVGLNPRLAVRFLRFYNAELAHHPKGERYWYLFAIAVRPGDRSLAALQQVFAAMLERIDADGAPTLLETARPELAFAVRRYYGFEVREEGVRIIKGGPPNWYLWRPARAPAGSGPAPWLAP